jgi:glycosyltransferase involved in cell wall biosynthesis
MPAPLISVIIPSRNRCASLERVLAGLALQTAPPNAYEVVVVLDGSSDGSARMLDRWQQEGRLADLLWIYQENAGQAAARNRGASSARGGLLLFLDDDVVPEPELVQAHLDAHSGGEKLVILGDAPVDREAVDSLYHLGAWAWWHDTYYNRSLPGRQPGSRDFCSGNVSLRRIDFFDAGGFNSAFRGYGGEDFELGYRLLKQGVRFKCALRAKARHYHRSSVRSVLRATRQEAHGDAVMARLHPELLPGLRLAALPQGSYKSLALLALLLPATGDAGVALALKVLPLLERLQLRKRWQRLFDHVRGYSYWRGIRDVFGSLNGLRAFQNQAPTAPIVRMELSEGLPQELPSLWVEGPSRIEAVWRGRHLGILHIERFIDIPLHEFLADQLAEQLGLRISLALAQDGKEMGQLIRDMQARPPLTEDGMAASSGLD